MADRSAHGVRVVVLPSETAHEGKRVDVIDGRVLEFVFEEEDHKANRFTLSLRNNDLYLFDHGEDVLPGATLEVSWGYPGNFSPPERFAVKKISGRDPVKIEGVALSVQAHRQTKTRAWHGKKRSEVAADVATELGYEGERVQIDDTAEVVDTINQMAETNAALLRRLAQREGFDFYIDATGFHFHGRRADAAPRKTLVWYADGTGTIIDWNPESNLIRRVGKTTVKGRDPIQKKDIEASATSETAARPTMSELREVVDPETRSSHYEETTCTEAEHATTATTQAEAQRQADTRFVNAEREAIKLTMTAIGDPSLRGKTVVECQGLSTMFSGKYYVSYCKHTLGAVYTCDLRLTRDGINKKPGGPESQTQAQGGQRNRNAPAEAGTVEVVEGVDPETRETYYTYRSTGGDAAGDPEARR